MGERTSLERERTGGSAKSGSTANRTASKELSVSGTHASLKDGAALAGAALQPPSSSGGASRPSSTGTLRGSMTATPGQLSLKRTSAPATAASTHASKLQMPNPYAFAQQRNNQHRDNYTWS